MPICRFAAEPPQGGAAAGGDPAGRVPRRLPARGDRGGRSRARRRGRDPLVPRPHVVGPHLRARDRAHGHRARALRLRVLRARRRGASELYAWADYTRRRRRGPPRVADGHLPGGRRRLARRARRGRGDDADLGRAVRAPRRGSSPPSSAETTVDEAEIVGERFTLLAPDAYDDAYLDIVLLGRRRERAGARVALRGRRRVAVAVVSVDDDAVDQAVVARLVGREEAVALEVDARPAPCGLPVCSA